MIQEVDRHEVLHVGGNWDNSGNAGPFATTGSYSALNANSNVSSFGVSFWSRLISRLVTRSIILSCNCKINTQQKEAATSRKSERRCFFETFRK